MSRTSSMRCRSGAACASCARTSGRRNRRPRRGDPRCMSRRCCRAGDRRGGDHRHTPQRVAAVHLDSRTASCPAAARRPIRNTPRPSRSIARRPRGTTKSVVRVARPGQEVRRLHRRRSHQLRGAPRRDLRAARTQWRRQDDHLPHALRLACPQPTASCAWPARTCAMPAPRRAPSSATSRRSSRCTAS